MDMYADWVRGTGIWTGCGYGHEYMCMGWHINAKEVRGHRTIGVLACMSHRRGDADIVEICRPPQTLE